MADIIRPMPNEKIKTKNMGIGNNNKVARSGTCVTIMTIKIATILKSMVTKLEITRANGKMPLGKYTFFSKDALPITEYIAAVVDSETKPNITCPIIKYNG